MNRSERVIDKAHLKARAELERITALADHLSPSDRALVRGVAIHGMSAGNVALAMGCSAQAGRKRLRRLRRRVMSPLFRFVVTQRALWPVQRRDIAEAIILRGQTQRDTAAILGMSVHLVRRELARIRFALEDQEIARRRGVT